MKSTKNYIYIFIKIKTTSDYFLINNKFFTYDRFHFSTEYWKYSRPPPTAVTTTRNQFCQLYHWALFLFLAPFSLWTVRIIEKSEKRNFYILQLFSEIKRQWEIKRLPTLVAHGKMGFFMNFSKENFKNIF